MRIISGKNKNAQLFMLNSMTTRPTMDKVKEAMFDIIGDVENCNVLDLYAGSGSLGLEALSRGANFVTFVEGSKKASDIIYKNIVKTNNKEKCKLHNYSVENFVKKTKLSFDIIFLDPPYKIDILDIMQKIIEREIINKSGIIIYEANNKKYLEIIKNYALEKNFKILADKEYGDTLVVILKRGEK